MGGAIRSEIRKIFTTRLWWGLLVGVVIIGGGISALFASLVGSTNAGSDPAQNPFLHMSVGTAQLIYSAGFFWLIAPLIPLALGVILITQEFRHQTISSTFLAAPRRWEVLISKTIAVVVIGIVYGVVSVISSGVFGALVLTLKGEATYLDNAQVWRTFVMILLVFVLWALLGFGFGMLVRNQLAAVFIALGIALIAQIILQILFGALGWDTAPKLLPNSLSQGMLVTSDPTNGASGDGSPYFVWWACGLILLGYAAALSGIGAWLLSKRDIT
ncbi:MAG: type transport system permease protein [Nocardioidaceae bacterium]|nr:type transport system permease protein [Nocardioidaceae bacterium]